MRAAQVKIEEITIIVWIRVDEECGLKKRKKNELCSVWSFECVLLLATRTERSLPELTVSSNPQYIMQNCRFSFLVA